MTDTDRSAALPVRAGQTSALGEEARTTLAALRMAALRCRAAARLELPGAVAMLGARAEPAGDVAAEAMARTIAQALGRRPRFYRPGSPEMSFDEAWLVALIEALRRDDRQSAAFLVRSRLPAHARRSILYLARQIAEGRVHSTCAAEPPYQAQSHSER